MSVQASGTVLLTGGAGYIGSHTYLALHAAGWTPVVLDDFSNSTPLVLERLQHLTQQPVLYQEGSVNDTALVEALLKRHHIRAVIHLAGYKSVAESVAQPLKYYANNIGGTLSLLHAMRAVDCRVLVFSSSATVYGAGVASPIAENAARSYTNPYGHSKLVCEDILQTLGLSEANWRIGVLRYFNPVGAHPSGLIGEDPRGTPNNLMPYIAQVAAGKRPYLNVYGADYATPDGTGVRDYIHVQDLAEGHLAALQALQQTPSFTVNLGSGQGHSVLDVVRAFRLCSGREVPYQIAARRSGDVAQSYADPRKAQQLLGWRAVRSLQEMCADAWRWQHQNPHGYDANP